MNVECRCGCGMPLPTPCKATLRKIERGLDAGYIRGHWQHGPRNARWRGGRFVGTQGYVLVHRPDHPNARSAGYALEHRLVMSDHLGRPLRDDEIVHHINGDKTDNRIENLCVTDRSEHASHHCTGAESGSWKGTSLPKPCLTCGRLFSRGSHTKRATYCDRDCFNRRNDVVAAEVRWERGYRVHGLWRGNTRVACVMLPPRPVGQDGYGWLMDWPTENRASGRERNLKAAKRAAFSAYADVVRPMKQRIYSVVGNA